MRRVRAGAALLLVGAVATYGAAGAAPALAVTATTPVGGCWSYTPAAPLTDLATPPAADVSTALEPWTTVADGGFRLVTGGATVVGAGRSLTVGIASGPVVSPGADAVGTASFLLSVDGQVLADPLQVDFAVDAGDPVTGLEATATVPLTGAGPHEVTLDAVYFDIPAATLRVACNGQTSGAPGGTNPATDPVPTDLAEAFTAVAAPSLAITSVDDQAVLTAARPGDVVTVEARGLASATAATVELCDAASACTSMASLQTDDLGAGTTSFMVPGAAAVGADTLRVGDGTTTASTALTVLAVQLVAAAEELETDATIVTLTGTGWDPGRAVTIQGYAGTDSSTAETDDAAVTAEVDAAGTFTADYEVADEDTESVIVDQARTASSIGAVYLISGVIGSGAGADGGDDGDDGDGEAGGDDDGDSGTGSTATGGAAGIPITPATPVEAPADIPLPEDVPVDEPTAEDPADAAAPTEDLAVSEARLDGRTTLSELFGGSPGRTLVFLLENVGDDTVANPVVRVSVGRSDDVEPQLVAADVDDLGPGERTVVSVPLRLPIAAFGTYHVVGQVGDTELGAFEVEWTTYPWGLFALNALALALLAVGVRHRLATRRQGPAGAVAVPAGDSVVDLTAAGAWWAYRAGAGPRPGAPAVGPTPRPARAVRRPSPSARVVDEPAAGEAIVDIDAAEQWWGRRSGDGGTRAS